MKVEIRINPLWIIPLLLEAPFLVVGAIMVANETGFYALPYTVLIVHLIIMICIFLKPKRGSE